MRNTVGSARKVLSFDQPAVLLSEEFDAAMHINLIIDRFIYSHVPGKPV